MSEAERYRAAAKAVLEQLDWAIGYLYRLRKPQIADVLRRNRTEILNRLDRPVPRRRSGARPPRPRA
jgi:hypothetical protein